ncbi:ribA/ribD-fused uncharacterized protein [Oxalobacteraceae bacterium GrIS 1.11]
MNKSIENTADLLEIMAQGCSPECLYFWGHTAAGKVVGKSCLSQWYPTRFTLDGVAYPSAEHYMMVQKAILFGDLAMAELMLATADTKEVKQLGRQVKNFDPAAWAAQCEQIVFDANLGKFSQNEKLREFLCSTGNLVLVEASPVDNVWGIGLTESAAKKSSPLAWKGKNLLGYALMKVRSAILDTIAAC